MTKTIEELLAFSLTAIIVGFSGAIVPGPMLTVSITESVRNGCKAGVSVVFGHMAAEMAMVVLLALGLSQVIGLKGPFIIISMIGGAILLFMGVNLVRSARKAISLEATAAKGRLTYGPVSGGLITSVSNPYFFMWWFAIGGTFIFEGLKLAGLVGLAAFLLGHWTSDFSWYGFVSVCTDKGSAIMGPKTYRFILIACGAFLALLGTGFVYNGIVSI